MTSSLQQKVLSYIHTYKLIHAQDRVLLAVSGGADSMALLTVLFDLYTRQRGMSDLICVHFNHGLRADQAQADEDRVKAVTLDLGLPLIRESLDVRAYAAHNALSLETAGRELRYRSLIRIARTRQCNVIATGHQKNDNAETIIHRIMRGTGLRGLTGIRPSRWITDNCRLVRPLLCVTRQDIIAYLRAQHITWCEDATNQDLQYTRNRIRHHHLPRLQEASHICLTDTLSELAHTTYRLYNRVETEIQSRWSTLVQSVENGLCLRREPLRPYPDWVICEVLRQVLTALGKGRLDTTFAHYDTLITMIKKGLPPAVDLPGSIRASCAHNQVLFRQRKQHIQTSLIYEDTTLVIPGTTSYGSCHIEAQWHPYTPDAWAAHLREKDQHTEWFDADKLILPLRIRQHRPGDRFRPLGQQGTQRVGKFLMNRKIPQSERSRVFIVTDQKGIVWVCPLRIEERVKITEQTRRVLVLKVKTD